MMADLTPADVAGILDTGVYNVRRWSEWHAEHLSEGAHPGPGRPRSYTRQDVEVLRVVRDLRGQGLTTGAINVRLEGLTVATVEEAGEGEEELGEIPGGPAEGPQAGQGGRSAELMPPGMVQMLTSLMDAQTRATEQRIDALERGQRERVLMFVYGLVAGLVGAVMLFWLAFMLARMAG